MWYKFEDYLEKWNEAKRNETKRNEDSIKDR